MMKFLRKNRRAIWPWYQWRLIQAGAKRKKPLFIGVGSTKLFLGFVFLLAVVPLKSEGEWTWKIWTFLTSAPNEIGDTLAGIAGALAFLWIIVTVMLQSSELAMQRKEISRQADEFEVMNKTMAQQSFNSFFFELLGTQNTIVNSLDLRKNGVVTAQGRDCFKSFWKDIKGYDLGAALYGSTTSTDKTHENFDTLMEKHGSDLSQYFRFTYNAMRQIKEAKSSTLQHRRLFRALFSDDELGVLFYNCFSKRGKKLVEFAEEFSLFDNLPESRVIKPEHLDEYQALVRELQ